MKKVCLFSLVLALCSISFFGCKNFMESEDFLTQLNDAVKYLNAPYANVEIKADSHAILSIMPAVGEYNSHFKAGDKITLKFEEQEAYSFVEWRVTPENAVVFDDAKERSTKATIISVEEPIVIEAYTVLRDKLQIKFDWEQGSVSAPSSLSFYLDEEFSFRYNGIADYAFVRWEVTDGKGIVRDDILQFSGNGIDATAKVLKVNESITIKAVTSKRPKVVSYSPLYNSDGVYRDRRIVVMFDRDMDESSIYYDADEQEKLKADGKKPIFDTAEGRKDKCYAYEDEDGNRHWKNITIQLRKVGTSYEEYYNAPYFDENDNSVLYIETIIGNPPPSGKAILVTVSPKMCSKNDKTELSGECSWAYYTNSYTDNASPKFIDFKVEFEGEGNKPTANTALIDYTKPENFSKIKINTGSKIKMKFSGKFEDLDSGPGDLWYEIVQIDSDYYQYDNDNREKLHSGTIKTEKNKTEAEIKNSNEILEIDPSEYNDGIYRIDIKAFDLNEKSTLFEQYYFIKDDTVPEFKYFEYGSIDNGVKLLLVKDSYQSSGGWKDVEKVEISFDNQVKDTITEINYEVILKNITVANSNGKTVTLSIKVCDYVGNYKEYKTKVSLGIKPGYYCIQVRDSKDEFFFINPDDYDDYDNYHEYHIGTIKGFVVGEPDKFVQNDVRIVCNQFLETSYTVCRYMSSSEYQYVITDSKDGFEFYKESIKNDMRTYYPLSNYLRTGKNENGYASILWYVPSLDELKWIVDANSKIPSDHKDLKIDFTGKKVISCYIDSGQHCINYIDVSKDPSDIHGWIDLNTYYNTFKNYSILLMGRVEL